MAFGAAIASLAQAATAAPTNLISDVDRFCMVRENTLNTLARVTEEQAAWSPREGKWSIVQIADHLLRTEEMYREQFIQLIEMARMGRTDPIKLGFADVNSSFAGIPRDIMRFFELPARMASYLMPQAVRQTIIRHQIVPAINPSASDPRPGATIALLRVDLASALAVTREILRAPMPRNLEGPTIVHPLLGRNNLRQLFRIVIAHEARHQEQIAAIRAHANYPAGYSPN